MCLTPINANSLAQVTKKYFDGHFCVKDLLFQSNVNSEGLDMADGILGLSPGNFMIAERLLDLGVIDDADSDSCSQRVAVPGAATRLVDNRFYDLWALGEDGCIIMKPQRPWVPFE